jgi:energy-coupling factor transporter transmembrane protein EcfT
MSKRTLVRWYIGAWIVWCLAFLILLAIGRVSPPSSSPPPGTFFLYFVMFLAVIVTFFMWAVTLLKLGLRRLWGWFVAVLVLHLVGIGIVGMAAYALAGPGDGDSDEIVYRPTAT